MLTTARRVMAGMAIMTVLGAAKEVQAWGERVQTPDVPACSVVSRVRSVDRVLDGLIGEARRRSATFRRLVEVIEATDGVVYVERGRCGHGVRACLAVSVTVAGPNRLLRIVVDASRPDEEIMVALGHELQHALEVLREPLVRSGSAMYFFYQNWSARGRQDRRQNSAFRVGDVFETNAAIEAGDAVRAELTK